jgi:NAD-dependent DNA ligase (contains BRCT domain type II)
LSEVFSYAGFIIPTCINRGPNIGCVHAKILAQEFGSAEKIFKAKQQLLEKIEGIGEVRAKAIKAFTNFSNAEEEIKFIEKYKIKSLFVTDKIIQNDY